MYLVISSSIAHSLIFYTTFYSTLPFQNKSALGTILSEGEEHIILNATKRHRPNSILFVKL